MSDRHPKWVRVEPGTVIPAGQPFAIRFLPRVGTWVEWSEYVPRQFEQTVEDRTYQEWFVDSSWKPPQCGEKHPSNDSVIPCQLEPVHSGDHFSTSGCSGGGMTWPNLPTKRAWGIVIAGDIVYPPQVGYWMRDGDKFRAYGADHLTPRWATFMVSEVRAFIPLTDEQVKRIEAHR